MSTELSKALSRYTDCVQQCDRVSINDLYILAAAVPELVTAMEDASRLLSSVEFDQPEDLLAVERIDAAIEKARARG